MPVCNRGNEKKEARFGLLIRRPTSGGKFVPSNASNRRCRKHEAEHSRLVTEQSLAALKSRPDLRYRTMAPSLPVAAIVAPGRYLPATISFAIGFSRSRWIARFTGRAPYAGS